MAIHIKSRGGLNHTRFGPSGYPAEAGGRVEEVFAILKRLGLDALEYAAVYGLRLSESGAKRIGELARATGVEMSMHAAYYISLVSKDPMVRQRSKERLIQALRMAPLMEVRRIVFHPGSYGGLTPEEAYVVVLNALYEVWNEAGADPRAVLLSPETSGKTSAFGSVEEILQLCTEMEGCIPTIDWAHLYARSQGKLNDRESYRRVIGSFENELGEKFLKNMHFHISGITFGKAGEMAHRPLGEEWGPDVQPLIELILDNGYNPTFISETPDTLRGAVFLHHLTQEVLKARR